MIYVVIKYSFPRVFSRPVEMLGLTRLPSDCYLLGRFIIHPRFGNKMAAVLFSLFHLVWRLGQHVILRRPFYFSALYFMLQPEEDIERFYMLLAESREASQAALMAPHPTINLSPRDDLTDIKFQGHTVGKRKIYRLKAGANNNNNTHTHHYNQDNLKDPHGLFLREHMCYKHTVGHLTEYKLRPNRTKEQRQRLANLVGVAFLSATILLASLLVIFYSVIFYIMAMDDRHQREYAGCHPESAVLNRAYRWFVTIFEVLENGVIWGESGIALIYIPCLTNFLHYDLLWYYEAIDKRIDHLASTLKDNYHSQVVPKPPARDDNNPGNLATLPELDEENVDDGEDDDKDEYISLYDDNPDAPNNTPGNVAILVDYIAHQNRHTNHDDDICDVQAQILDFFHEVRKSDLVISDAITAGFLIWVFTFSVFGYVGLDYYNKSKQTDLPLFLAIVQTIVLIGFVGPASTFMNLSTKCRKSYARISALVAHDRSIYKKDFIGILDLYTHGMKFSYSLFQQYAFSPASILTLVGSSITCFLLFDNVFIGTLKGA